MTYEQFLASIQPEGDLPPSLSPELESLWHAKAGHWHAAHEIAQDIPSKTGSRIHGLLHAIEGDFGNSAYWYHRAESPSIRGQDIDQEWETLVRSLLKS